MQSIFKHSIFINALISTINVWKPPIETKKKSRLNRIFNVYWCNSYSFVIGFVLIQIKYGIFLKWNANKICEMIHNVNDLIETLDISICRTLSMMTQAFTTNNAKSKHDKILIEIHDNFNNYPHWQYFYNNFSSEIFLFFSSPSGCLMIRLSYDLSWFFFCPNHKKRHFQTISVFSLFEVTATIHCAILSAMRLLYFIIFNWSRMSHV